MTLHNHDFIPGAHYYNKHLLIQQLLEWKRVDEQNIRLKIITDNLYMVDFIYNLLCLRDISMINIYINTDSMNELPICITPYTGTESKYVSYIHKSFMEKHKNDLINIKVEHRLKLFLYKYKEKLIPIKQRRYYDMVLKENI